MTQRADESIRHEPRGVTGGDKIGVSWLLRAMHSLSGVVVVGAFMLLQLWAHAKALDGPAAHRDALIAVHPSHWAVQVLILAPFGFHAVYGVMLTLRPRYNVDRYPFSRNWTYTLQHITGLVAAAFIVLHIALFWWTPPHPDELPALMVEQLSSTYKSIPVVGLAFMIGIGACAFHFAAGLWTFCVRWGLVSTPRSQQQAGFAFALLGVAIMLWGGHSVTFLATGWRVTEPPPADPAVFCSDPASLGAPVSAAPSPPSADPAPSATGPPR